MALAEIPRHSWSQCCTHALQHTAKQLLTSKADTVQGSRDTQPFHRRWWLHRESGRGELSDPCVPVQSSPGPAPALPSWPSASGGHAPTGSCPCPTQLSLHIRPHSFPHTKTSPSEAAAGKSIPKQQFNFFRPPDHSSSHSNHTHTRCSLNIFTILRIMPPSNGYTLLTDSKTRNGKCKGQKNRRNWYFEFTLAKIQYP